MRRARYLAPIVERILILGNKEHDEATELEFNELEVLRDQRRGEQMDAIPKLTCCEEARSYHAIRFSLNFRSDTPAGGWRITESEELGSHRRSRDPDWYKKPDPEPKFCPFCATPVPKMGLKKEPPKDLCVPIDPGYCDTCGERLTCCWCLPPEAAYEPVPGES